jgi:hypothetical protein
MKINLIGAVAALSFLYFVAFSTFDPRFDDGGLYWHEMHTYEIPLFLALLIGTFFLWFKGMSSCFRSGKTGKAILCFAVWPYSVYLAIKENNCKQMHETA